MFDLQPLRVNVCTLGCDEHPRRLKVWFVVSHSSLHTADLSHFWRDCELHKTCVIFKFFISWPCTSPQYFVFFRHGRLKTEIERIALL